MSFRMRGAALDQGCRTARYAATWVLIVSMTSSSIVLGAPNRREARRAKKNCCPAPTCCAPVTNCDACSSCESGEMIAPTITPAEHPPSTVPDKPPPDPKPENRANSAPAPAPQPEVKSDAKAPVPGGTTGFRAPIRGPKSYSPLASDRALGIEKTPPTPERKPEAPMPEPSAVNESAIQDAQPIVLSDEAPPVPATSEPFRQEPNNSSTEPESPPTIEPPKPATGGAKYQEYIERYFDRKNAEPTLPPDEEPRVDQKAPVSPPLDEPPTLTPSKPAKEYNDPFRPTSYRNSYERTWRDSSGSSRMKARFLGVDEKGFALMEREDGKRTRVPLANLSASDQRFIELLAIRDTNVSTQNIASRPKGK